jgi:diguanylate cyclase (GGDEF)-like protein/PAS domain S-box-containing protein
MLASFFERLTVRARFLLIALAGGVPLVALVWFASTEVQRTANVVAGMVVLVLSTALAALFAAWTARSLRDLTEDVERLGTDLAHRSSVRGGEFSDAAAAFDRVAAALEAREKALLASRDQLREIANTIPGQIVYIDRDERYRYINAYRSNTPDRIAEDIVGKTVREVRGERLYALVADRLHRALAGERQTFEALSPTPGPDHWFRTALIPARDGDGNVHGLYSFSQDVTERKTAELLRDLSEKRLVTITDNLPAMICYVDDKHCFRFVNRAFEKWFQRPLAEIVGRPYSTLMPGELTTQFDRHFARGMRGEVLEAEIEITVRGGGRRWLRCAFIPDMNEVSGEVRGVYGMINNVTRAKRAEQRLSRLARFDSLTGLANRHQFNETLERTLGMHDAANDAANDAASPALALMFLDIDHFKQVNDRHGHGAGDALLREFAQRLSDCVRPTDVVARLSGDEFVILLEGMHADDEPQFIARKIIATVEKPFVLDDHPTRVTTSIGIAMRGHAGDTAPSLMKRADEALYEAKRAGRNTFRMAR